MGTGAGTGRSTDTPRGEGLNPDRGDRPWERETGTWRQGAAWFPDTPSQGGESDFFLK